MMKKYRISALQKCIRRKNTLKTEFTASKRRVKGVKIKVTNKLIIIPKLSAIAWKHLFRNRSKCKGALN